MSEEKEPITIAQDTLLGDMMSFIRDEFKAMPDVYQKLSEEKQRCFLERCEARARQAVIQCCEIIAAQNRPVIKTMVESVTFKDGVKAVVRPNSISPLRHALADMVGSEVLIVIGSADDFTHDDGKPDADPDQSDLALGETEKAERDPLYHEALAYVSGLKNPVSISQTQRKLKIGYNRAAKLLELLVNDGVLTEAGNDGRFPIIRDEKAA